MWLETTVYTCLQNTPKYVFSISSISFTILMRNRLRLFCYGLFGICTPVILLLTFGSDIGAAIANNPTWLEGYHLYSTGGILGAMLAPAGRFGKFVLVILSFSVIGICSRELYQIANDFQKLIRSHDLSGL
jgi:purine-cytosine permease-like protein